VVGLSNVTAIYSDTFAVEDNSSVWTWGATNNNANTANANPVPYQIPDLYNITYIDTDPSFTHTLLVKADGTVWSWGSDFNSQLGDGTDIINDPPYVSVPIQVKGLDNVKMVQAGEGQSSMALKNDGTVWVWGQNSGGQQGLDNTSSSNNPAPVEVMSIKNVSEISSNYLVSAFLTSDGGVWMAGEDFAGQIGDGNIKTYTSVTIPYKALGPNNSNLELVNSSTNNLTNNSTNFATTTAPINNRQDWSSYVILVIGLVVVVVIGSAIYLRYKKR
jgi:alpha-tubulin suppressor-like RCC1 family protein